MKIENTHRSHRTALVIDTTNEGKDDFGERVNRLLESVNGDNIKVDTFTLEGNKNVAVSSGGTLRLRVGVPGGTATDDESAYTDVQGELESWAREQGYTVLLRASAV